MAFPSSVSRRRFLQSSSLATVGAATSRLWSPHLSLAAAAPGPLREFTYRDVAIASEIHEKQLHNTHTVLMELSEDSLLKPFRQMVGQPAPGDDMGGWYHYNPNYRYDRDEEGFAPAAPFGQWVSALARVYAITGAAPVRDKVLRLNRLYARTIASDFYAKNRFPAYCYDKLVCGLLDSHSLVGDPDALAILERTTDTALPQMPKTAIEHGKSWRPNTDVSFTWDESYTISENLLLAYQRGAGSRYRELGKQFLDDEYYDPLSEGKSNLAGRHAYSHVNSLSSAMQAYLTLGSQKHLRAAQNAFDMLLEQSFVTGGWGPDETLRAPNSGEIFESLTRTHSGFETPCGAYAHFKLTRYLLRVTRDARYGDSMERVMYNTILGAKPLQADGRTFYYSDYNFQGRKVYSPNRWPCCAGTMPQVAADYRINTYFRDDRGIYVNLYIPSTLRWVENGSQVSVQQSGSYPFASSIQFDVTASRPEEFALNFRIPAWAEGASVSLNGDKSSAAAEPGTFASIHRVWKTGDRVELELPMRTRLEAVDSKHPETVGLLVGPLALFAIASTMPRVTRRQLLAAERAGLQKWQVQTQGGALPMLPFIGIEDEQYTTYLTVS